MLLPPIPLRYAQIRLSRVHVLLSKVVTYGEVNYLKQIYCNDYYLNLVSG
jgi:hypothetical protein